MGSLPTFILELPPLHDRKLLLSLADILKVRLNHGVKQVLVQWQGTTPEEASWELVEKFKDLFPDFKLEDKLVLLGGCVDTFIGKTYQRRKRKNEVHISS